MDRALGTLRAACGATLAALLLLPPTAAQGRADEDPGPALAGTPVEGSTDPAQAPALTTGRHLDRLPSTRPLHYRLPRTEDATTFHVAAMFVGSGDSVGEGLRLEIGTTPGGQGCGSGGVFRPTLGEPAPVLFATVSTWTDSGDHPCALAEELHLVVGVPDDPEDAGRAVELLVYEEPPLSSYSFDLLADPAEPAWTPVEPARRARDVGVGTTPTNAPVVGDGTYALTLRPGGTAVLAVPLDWDQSLQAQLDARLPADAPAPDAIGVQLAGPLLGTSEVSFAPQLPAGWTRDPRPGASLRTGAQSQVVSYTNRDSYDIAVNTEALAGIHYVLVRWTGTDDAGPDAQSLEVPATLTLRTSGVASEGIPAYTSLETVFAPRAGSRLVDGTLRAPPPPARAAPEDDEDGGQGLPSLGLVGAGVALGLLLLVGATRRAGRGRGR